MKMDVEARQWAEAVAFVDEHIDDAKARVRGEGFDALSAPVHYAHVRRSREQVPTLHVFRAHGTRTLSEAPPPFPTAWSHGALIPAHSPWWVAEMAMQLIQAGLPGDYPLGETMDRPELICHWEIARDHKHPAVNAPELFTLRGERLLGPSPAELAASGHLAVAKSAALAKELGYTPAPPTSDRVLPAAGRLTLAEAHARGLVREWLREAHVLLDGLAAA